MIGVKSSELLGKPKDILTTTQSEKINVNVAKAEKIICINLC